MSNSPIKNAAGSNKIPETPLFERQRNQLGYAMNKMAMALSKPENREAFKTDESAFIDLYGLTSEQKQAVMDRDWKEMVRLGGNLFYILKITAVDPLPLTKIGAAQAGMNYEEFLKSRLGKEDNG